MGWWFVASHSTTFLVFSSRMMLRALAAVHSHGLSLKVKSRAARKLRCVLSLSLSLMSFPPLYLTPVWYHWSRFNIIRCTCPSISYLMMNLLLYNLAQFKSTLTYPICASVYSLFIFFLMRLSLRVFGLTTFQALHAIGKVLHSLLTCKDSIMSKVCAVICRYLETVRGLFCDTWIP